MSVTTSDDNRGRALARANARARRRLIESLTRARIASGLTQTDVADMIGLTPEKVAAFETREESPTLDRIANYAQAVGAYLHYSITSTRKDTP